MQTLRSGNPGGALISVVPFGSQLFDGPQWTSAIGVKQQTPTDNDTAHNHMAQPKIPLIMRTLT